MKPVASLPTGADVCAIARNLLGYRIRTSFGGEVTLVVVTEVEAYDGSNDPASHAYRGETPRNGTMFGPPGGLYVYRSYGIHWCMNIAVAEAGVPAAVLLRGGEILEGQTTIIRRRGRDTNLTDGPGKLTQALGVTGDHDGVSVFGDVVSLLEPIHRMGPIAATPRIGISKATDRLWRFVAQPLD